MRSIFRAGVVGVVLVVGWAGWPSAQGQNSRSRPASPPRSGAVRPAATEAKPAADPGWGQTAAAGEGFPIDTNHQRVELQPGSPLVLVGAQLYRIDTGRPVNKPLAELNPKDYSATYAIDSGGQHLAGVVSVNFKHFLRLWSVQTGQPLWTEPLESSNSGALMGFADGHLLVRWASEIRKLKVDTGAVVWTQPTDLPRGLRLACGVDPSQRYFAIADLNDTITIFSVEDGRKMSVLKRPAEKPASGPAIRDPKQMLEDPIAKMRNEPAKPTRTASRPRAMGLAFSPDGASLAAVFSTQPAALVIWDTTGRVTHEGIVPLPGTNRIHADVSWAPDGRSLLINGKSLYDLEAGRIVAFVARTDAPQVLGCFVDQDHVLTIRRQKFTNYVESLTVPWDAIRQSLADMAGNHGVLTPGQAVSLVVEVTDARGDVEETRSQLLAALRQRVELDGFQVTSEPQAVSFQLRMSEAAGKVMPLFEQKGPLRIQGEYTGQNLTEAKGAAVLEIMHKGKSEPLWSQAITAQSATDYRGGKVDDQVVRQSMIDSLLDNLRQAPMSYFIPTKTSFSALPVIIE